MPGREAEYEAYMAQGGGQGGMGGGAPAPPPIDADRRSRSPGLQHNFYETDISDFKRPYGAGAGGLSPPAPASQPDLAPAQGRQPSSQQPPAASGAGAADRHASERREAAAARLRAAAEGSSPTAGAIAPIVAPHVPSEVPPLIAELPSLLTQAEQSVAVTVRKRANALFQQQLSSIDVTADILPDFDKTRAECLKQAQQELDEDGGAAIERMRKARAVMLEMASAFADAVATLEGNE